VKAVIKFPFAFFIHYIILELSAISPLSCLFFKHSVYSLLMLLFSLSCPVLHYFLRECNRDNIHPLSSPTDIGTLK